MNVEIEYERGLQKIREMYVITTKEAQIALFQAYKHFLDISELERFIIPLKEKKLNKRKQQ